MVFLMIIFTQGNLLEAKVEALVNTVNTVGVMGKGISLMFKERFHENFRLYSAACKAKEVQIGKMFVTPVYELALQLQFLLSSEYMGNHDSGYDEWRCVC